jgi:hypothetical protein
MVTGAPGGAEDARGRCAVRVVDQAIVEALIMENFVVAAFRQLLTQTPVLVVYVIGMLLGAVLCSRCRAAGLLVVASMVLLFFVSIAWAFGIQYVLASRTRWGWLGDQLGTVMTVGGLLINLAHATGIGLLIAAAFVGRQTVANWQRAPE